MLLAASEVQAEVGKELTEVVPAVKLLPNRECSGMFEYRHEDEPMLIKYLIIGNLLCEILSISGIKYSKTNDLKAHFLFISNAVVLL